MQFKVISERQIGYRRDKVSVHWIDDSGLHWISHVYIADELEEDTLATLEKGFVERLAIDIRNSEVEPTTRELRQLIEEVVEAFDRSNMF